MSTIPADPTMVLGQLVSRKKLKQLESISKAMEPQIQARDKYDALNLAIHNLEGIFRELVSMRAEDTALQSIKDELESTKNLAGQAAVALAEAYIACQTKVAQLKSTVDDGGKIEVTPESPFRYNDLKVSGQPVATDSMQFDVQFFRKEKEDSSSNSLADVSSFIETSTKNMWNGDTTKSTSLANKSLDATEHHYKNHEIEGTLVIVCQCTHKVATFVEGTVDGGKAVSAWNQTFPNDPIRTDAASLMEAAVEDTSSDKSKNKNALQLLTGQTFGSTFVGLAHILEVDTNESNVKSKSVDNSTPAGDVIEQKSEELKQKFAWEQGMREMEGKVGVSDEFVESMRDSLSKTRLTAHCSIICQGAAPTIQASQKKQMIQQQQPSTMATLEKLKAVTADAGAEGTGALRGAQFMKLDTEAMKGAANAIDEKKRDINVIDMDSLLVAFKNYLDIVKGMNGDNDVGGGVPLNFYLKEIDKKAVAKAYIQQYYPQGISSAAATIVSAISRGAFEVSDKVKNFLEEEGFLPSVSKDGDK